MSVAFKEWAVVCAAMEKGLQSVILRKGGIAEGREGFAFLHREFYMFPTRFHESLEKTTILPGIPLPVSIEGQVEIRIFANIGRSFFVDDEQRIEALRGFHVLSDEVVRERFFCGETHGLHIAFARIFRLETPWILPMEKRFGGCRSWLDLPECPADKMFPVLPESEHLERERLFLSKMGDLGIDG